MLTYEELEAENARMLAIIEERWHDIRLVRYVDGVLDLAGGPLPLIIAYMRELMTKPEGGMHNYTEMQIQPKDGGEGFIFNIQRIDGKTPHQLMIEAQEELAKIKAWAQDWLEQ